MTVFELAEMGHCYPVILVHFVRIRGSHACLSGERKLRHTVRGHLRRIRRLESEHWGIHWRIRLGLRWQLRGLLRWLLIGKNLLRYGIMWLLSLIVTFSFLFLCRFRPLPCRHLHLDLILAVPQFTARCPFPIRFVNALAQLLFSKLHIQIGLGSLLRLFAADMHPVILEPHHTRRLHWLVHCLYQRPFLRGLLLLVTDRPLVLGVRH
jgi:hypothetical protein